MRMGSCVRRPDGRMTLNSAASLPYGNLFVLVLLVVLDVHDGHRARATSHHGPRTAACHSTWATALWFGHAKTATKATDGPEARRSTSRCARSGAVG